MAAKLEVGFPVYCVLASASATADLDAFHIICGGGGGGVKSGVPNGLALYKFDPRTFGFTKLHFLSSHGDAVMCLSRLSGRKFVAGVDKQVWKVAIGEERLWLLSHTQADFSGSEDADADADASADADGYVRLVNCDEDTGLIMTAGSDDLVRLWTTFDEDEWSEHDPGCLSVKDIVDCAFIGSSQIMSVERDQGMVLFSGSRFEHKDFINLSIPLGYQIKCVRMISSDTVILALINRKEKQSLILFFENTTLKETGLKPTGVSFRIKGSLITTAYGRNTFLAVGCSDGRVLCIDSNGKCILDNQNAHSFAVTSVMIHDDQYLISGSADGTILVTRLYVYSRQIDNVLLVLMSLILLLLAYLIQSWNTRYL